MAPCGSCGQRAANKEIEVTLRDGSKVRVKSVAERRLVMQMDTTEGDRAQTWRYVDKIA